MKKNILMILLCSVAVTPLCYAPLRAEEQEIVADQQEPNSNGDNNEEDVEDFFGEPNAASITEEDQKPQKSKLQLFMIKLGVAVALKTQTFCQWVGSVWTYLKSWVICEKTATE